MSWKSLIRLAIQAGATEVVVRVIELLLEKLQKWSHDDPSKLDQDCTDIIRAAAWEKDKERD